MFVWLSAPALPDHKLCVIAREDDYFFGVLQSRLHTLWAQRAGARHGVGNDLVYNVGDCFETFPFPWPPGKESQDDLHVHAIADAAQELVQLRETQSGSRTLTQLYNERPMWLDNALCKLNAAVFAAHGWPDDLSDDDTRCVARLLALNMEQAGHSDAE